MFQDTTKTAQRPSDTFSKNTEKDGLSIPDLREQAELYIAIYCYAQSPKTIRGKRDVLAYLIGFLERTKARTCNPLAMARFFRHCINGHTEPEGRLGRGATCGNSKPYKPLRPRSLQLYHIYLKTFFDKLVEEGIIPKSPMHGMKRPKALEEEIYPFTENHIDGLLTAADKSKAPLRNRALLLLMWDTGIRLTELCSLYQGDLDLKTSTVVIRKGKNSKMRICVFSNETALALLRYKRSLSVLKLEDDDHLFLTFAQGSKTPLQPNGVYQLYKRLGKAAGLKNVRCSPHTMRHTFATGFMMGGASQKAAMRQLGQSDLKTIARYQHMVDAQLESIHKVASPVERHFKKAGRN